MGVAQIITQEALVEVILIQGELVAQIIIQEIQVEAMSILEEKMPFPCQIANPLCIILYQQLLRAFLQILFKSQCANVHVKFLQKAVLISSIVPNSNQSRILILHVQILLKMADLTLKMTSKIDPISILRDPVLMVPSSNQDLISILLVQILFKMADLILKMTTNPLDLILILEDPILILVLENCF